MKEPTEDMEEGRTRNGEVVRLGDISHNVALNRSIQSRDESRRDDRALGALADDVVAAVDGCDFGRGGWGWAVALAACSVLHKSWRWFLRALTGRDETGPEVGEKLLCPYQQRLQGGRRRWKIEPKGKAGLA